LKPEKPGSRRLDLLWGESAQDEQSNEAIHR